MIYTLDSSEFFSTLWKESVVGLAKVSSSGRFININPKFCDIIEYTESEMSSKTFQVITHPEDLADDVMMVSKCLSGDIDSYIMSKRYITKTGRVVWVKLNVSLLKEEGKEPCFLVQVVPVIGVPSSATIPLISVKQSSLVEFFKTNWKWSLAILGGILTFSYKIVAEWQYVLSVLRELQK